MGSDCGNLVSRPEWWFPLEMLILCCRVKNAGTPAGAERQPSTAQQRLHLLSEASSDSGASSDDNRSLLKGSRSGQVTAPDGDEVDISHSPPASGSGSGSAPESGSRTGGTSQSLSTEGSGGREHAAAAEEAGLGPGPPKAEASAPAEGTEEIAGEPSGQAGAGSKEPGELYSDTSSRAPMREGACSGAGKSQTRLMTPSVSEGNLLQAAEARSKRSLHGSPSKMSPSASASNLVQGTIVHSKGQSGLLGSPSEGSLHHVGSSSRGPAQRGFPGGLADDLQGVQAAAFAADMAADLSARTLSTFIPPVRRPSLRPSGPNSQAVVPWTRPGFMD